MTAEGICRKLTEERTAEIHRFAEIWTRVVRSVSEGVEPPDLREVMKEVGASVEDLRAAVVEVAAGRRVKLPSR